MPSFTHPYIHSFLSSQGPGAETRWTRDSLWADLCAGHDDELAMDQPDANWGWIIEQGADVIQTDRPEALLKYLAGKNLRNK